VSAEPVPVRIDAGRFTIEGKSRAGNETWFRIRELGVALDVGRCPDRLVGLQHVFVTHAHIDHALGIPFYFTQRKLHRLPPGTVYIPGESVAGFEELIRVHESLENTHYEYRFVGLVPGDSVALRRDLAVRAHRSTHRVPANAYEFFERRHKLLPDFAGRSGGEMAMLRERGEAVEEQIEHSILFYTGDTDRGILEQNEAIFRSDVLMIECSFTGPDDQERGVKYRHIHIDDIWEFAGSFENRMIVLTHFSLRDDAAEIHRRIDRRCPPSLRGRLRLALPEPFARIE
jgi:ribonuclease Z